MNNTILIVEDDKDILQLLHAIFDCLENYKTLFAQNGREAIDTVQANSPNVIIMDIQLPDSTGYDVCKKIKAIPAMCDTKVLMLSGMTQYADRLKAKEAGADDYITKPFSSTELLEKVEGILSIN